MLFNSLEFLAFFPTVVVLYFATPHRFRWILLLIASYYFYACWKVEYLVLIASSTLIDYCAGLQMGKTEEKPKRKKYLLLSIACNLGLLSAFKYFNFVNDSVGAVFDTFNIFYGIPSFNVLLPVGISFYTFQTLSYTIDVYRGKRPPEKHLGIFALYVSFFPQLVAGPIERSTRLLPQFYKTHRFDWERVKSGLLLTLWGYFKKVVIADRVGIYVDSVYNQPAAYEGMHLILASYLFVYQIYCDFSGYSDIAIGTARVMGYELMDNFRRPFAARSMGELWQRWHISLTGWIMDYLYFPLIIKSSKRWQQHCSTFLVFVIIGLWHGAAWNFILFGGYVGFILVFGEITKPYRKRLTDFLFPECSPTLGRLHKGIQILTVFLCMLFACVLFRSNSISHAFLILRNMFRNLHFSEDAILIPKFSGYELVIAGLAILLLEIIQWIHASKPICQTLAQKPIWIRWSVYYTLIFGILIFGEFNLTPFVYFQF